MRASDEATGSIALESAIDEMAPAAWIPLVGGPSGTVELLRTALCLRR
jgi:hypothetical protein